MSCWIVRELDGIIDTYEYLIDAQLAVECFEREDKLNCTYNEYEIIFEGVAYEDLSTTAKVNCMNEFIDKMIPYEWDEVNDGSVADLETTIKYWIGEQYQIDENGYWYDEGRRL